MTVYEDEVRSRREIQAIVVGEIASGQYSLRPDQVDILLDVQSSSDRLTVQLQIVNNHGTVVDSDPIVTIRLCADDILTSEARPWATAGEFTRDAAGFIDGLRWGRVYLAARES